MSSDMVMLVVLNHGTDLLHLQAVVERDVEPDEVVGQYGLLGLLAAEYPTQRARSLRPPALVPLQSPRPRSHRAALQQMICIERRQMFVLGIELKRGCAAARESCARAHACTWRAATSGHVVFVGKHAWVCHDVVMALC